MARLNHNDVSRLLAAVQQLHGHSDFSTLPQLMVALQSQFIPSEMSSYTFMDKRTHRAEVVQDVPGLDVAKLFPAFLAHYHEHPVVRHCNQTKDLRALKVTDFLSQKQFERTGYYNEFSKHLEVRFQLIFYLINNDEAELTMLANRRARDFSERDRTIASLLRPHFAQAYQNGKTFSEMRRQEERTDAVLQSNHAGLIFLTDNLKVERLTGNCERWLNGYFARRQYIPVQLPDTLRRWVEQQRAFTHDTLAIPRPPLVVEGADANLTVRFSQDARRNVTLLLSEQRKSKLGRRRFHPLQVLSKRQNEVLAWMVEGKRNGEIASILHISERTVEKHVAEILAALHTENRATAIVRALELTEAANRAMEGF